MTQVEKKQNFKQPETKETMSFGDDSMAQSGRMQSLNMANKYKDYCLMFTVPEVLLALPSLSYASSH